MAVPRMASIDTLCSRMAWWCRDVSLGYSQADRWDIRPGGNCDCSSLVIHCLQEAGFDTGTASYTGNMSANLTARGFVRVANDGNPKRGDILLNDVHHVAVYLGNGQLAQASISENNSAYGVGGDQTGRETNISAYYNYPWDCYLRYAGATTDDEGDDDMPYAFAYTSKNFGGIRFFDGTYIHYLTDPDELVVLQNTYRQSTGRELPVFNLGEKGSPWETRFEQAIGRRNI